mgnify:FL=1
MNDIENWFLVHAATGQKFLAYSTYLPGVLGEDMIKGHPHRFEKVYPIHSEPLFVPQQGGGMGMMLTGNVLPPSMLSAHAPTALIVVGCTPFADMSSGDVHFFEVEMARIDKQMEVMRATRSGIELPHNVSFLRP